MLSKQTALIGAGALALGSVFGHLVSGPGGTAKRNIADLQAANAAMSKQIDALGETRDALTEQLAQLSTDQSGIAAAQADLSTQMSDMSGQIAAIKDTAQAQTAKLTASVYALETEFAAVKAQTAPAPAAKTVAATSEANDAPATDEKTATAPDSALGVEITGPGRTAKLADNLRVFLGRADADAKRATAAVNGINRVSMRLNQPLGVTVDGEFCHVTLTNLTENGAHFAHLCGADVPAPVGLVTGQTAVFEDQGIRAFVSRVDAAKGAAVIAVNGLAMQHIDYDAPLTVRGANARCKLSLNNIDRGHADLGLDC